MDAIRQEDILDKYALNRLDEADQVVLKELLAQDPAFQKELDLHADIVKGMSIHMEDQLLKTIQSVDTALDAEGFFAINKEEEAPKDALEKELVQNIQQLGEKELASTIKAVDKELEKEGFFEQKTNNNTARPIFRIVKMLAAAASIILVLTFSWQYINPSTDVAPIAFATEFEHYDNGFSKQVEGVISEKGFGGNPEEDELGQLLKGMQAYDSQNYAIAIQLLSNSVEKGISEGPQYQNQANLFLALSYWGNQEDQKAKELLQALAQQDNKQKEVAIWYLAKLQLKDKNLGLAKEQLELLQSSKTYGSKAKGLLEKL